MKLRRVFGIITVLTLMVTIVQAEPEVKTVLDGLTNPAGIAVQPKTGHVFVSDSGAGRVIRVVDGKAQNVITGFPLGSYGKGPMYGIGPLGLTFIDRDTLVVGGGGLPDGEEMLRVYKIPVAGASAIKAGGMAASFKLTGDADTKGEGNFYGLANNGKAIFVSSNGDDTKGWIAKASLKGGKVTKFERSIATKEAVEVDAPTGVAIAADGSLVVGQLGEITVPQDSLVSFYDTRSGKLLDNFETGLFDITGLAYSPKGKLFATDFAWMDTSQGGLFELKVARGSQSGVEAKKVLSLDKPTALTFSDWGELYVTVIGTSKEGSPAGKLLLVSGLK